jgi:Holliday junction resolvase-like predicted endonuclease
MQLRRRLRAVCIEIWPRWFARVLEPDDAELGRLGEAIAARALLDAGFSIEGRRVRTPHGEVDIVAVDGRQLVCVEVKSARFEPVPIPRGASPDLRALAGRRWRPGARLSPRQIERLMRAGRSLARERGLRVRVDLVEVRLDRSRRSFAICHERDVRGAHP